MAVPISDEEIAAALAEHREAILGQVHAETDRRLGALVEAFGRGHWGSFYCLFTEPTSALRRLTELGIAALPHLVRLPDAVRLVGRLLEVESEMALIIIAGDRASREREVRDVRELLEVKNDLA